MTEKTKQAKKIPLSMILCGLASLCAIGLSVFLILTYSRSSRELADINRQIRETRAIADQLNDVKTEVKTARKHLENTGMKGVKKDISNNADQLPKKIDRIQELKDEISGLEEQLAAYDSP